MGANYRQGVYDKVSSPVNTIDTHRKGINTGTATTVDTEVIFNRTLGMIVSGKFHLHGLFSDELTPIPTLLFLDDGSMRPASSK